MALDKLDKIGVEGVAKEFAARGIAEAAGAKALEMFAAAPRAARGGAAAAAGSRCRRTTAVGEPERRSFALTGATPAAGRIRLDPSLARGLSYYTGAIMEIAVEGIGSLGGGGRYDNLIGMFLGRDVPACGFSLGLERIIVIMTERGMFPARGYRRRRGRRCNVPGRRVAGGGAAGGVGAAPVEAARRRVSRTPAGRSTSR